MYKKIIQVSCLVGTLCGKPAYAAEQNISDRDAADLVKVDSFVRRQLQKTGIINPDTISVKFSPEPLVVGDGYGVDWRYNKKTYVTTKITLQVPKNLLMVLHDKQHDESFEDDATFCQWFNKHLGTQSKDAERLSLYQPAIAVINRGRLYEREVEGNFQQLKYLINQQRLKNYRRAKAVIDHEATHIQKEHPLQKLIFNKGASLFTGSLTMGVSVWVMNNKHFWHDPTVTSITKIPLIAASGLSAYYLLKQAFSRACELEADKGIRSKPHILRANADDHRYSWLITKSLPYKNKIANLLASHPLGCQRALLMEQRADALEKKK